MGSSKAMVVPQKLVTPSLPRYSHMVSMCSAPASQKSLPFEPWM